MTVVSGPWTGPPVVQEETAAARRQSEEAADDREREAEDRGGYEKPDHRPRADPCSPICHACPLLKNPDGRFDVMPGCSGGAISNRLSYCYCDYDGPPTSGMGASY